MSISTRRHGARTRAGTRRGGRAAARGGEQQMSLGGVLAPPRAVPVPERTPQRPAAPGGSLDALLSGAWAGLQSQNAIACPVCDATMAPVHDEHAAVSGRCGSCGTRLD